MEEDFEGFFSKYKQYILLFLLLLVFIIFSLVIFFYFSNKITDLRKDFVDEIIEDDIIEKSSVSDDDKQFMVDVKGEVKNPGVYLLDSGSRVIDAVKTAGGFTSNANTSVNNLSMKVFDEMVIIIYSKKEIEEYLTTKTNEQLIVDKCKNDDIKNDSCVMHENEDKSDGKEEINDANDTKKDNLVSINTGSKTELMSLPGIGEAKANAIIEYRKTNKFKKIEDIKNVSGIGDSVFEKIKDFITI